MWTRDHWGQWQAPSQAAPRLLRRRLELTRWPDPETVSDWSQGVPLAQAAKWSVAMALIGANTPSRSERVAVKLWQVAALLSVAL